MTHKELFLGIDAGNTKTVAIVTDASGQVWGAGRAGPGNIYVRKSAALRAIREAATTAAHSAGLPDLHFQAITLSATGADFPADFQELNAFVREWGWAPRIEVVNDAVGALRAGTPAGIGVMVACGTGTGTAARSETGRVWHSSYWQHPEGADDLGRQAIQAVLRSHLGLTPPTALTQPVLKALHSATPDELLYRLNGRGQRRPRQLGRLARVLLDCAAEGDSISASLVRLHGSALGDMAVIAARKVQLPGDFLLITAGGVMRHPSPLLRDALVQRVRETFPEVICQPARLEPVYGAALLAMELGGLTIRAQQFDQLNEHRAAPDFFLT